MKTFSLEEVVIKVRDYSTTGNLHDVAPFRTRKALDNLANDGMSEDGQEVDLLPTVRANVSIRDSKGRFVSFRNCENIIKQAVERVRPSHDARWEYITA